LDERPPELAPQEPPNRHRLWQALSILAIASGALLAFGALVVAQAATVDPSLSLDRDTYLALLRTGGLLLIVGCVANAARAVVVRRWLPPTRYRGPSVLVLLLLAAALSVGASAFFAADALALTTGEGQASLLGTAVILTATQLALLLVTLLFVAWPRALPGWQLLPEEGLPRSILLGIGLAFPAWFAVSIVAALMAELLRQAGIQPQPEPSQQLLTVADPVIAVLATVVVAPVAEELFFRGVAFSAWSREYGVGRALLLSALLFAIIHASLVAFLPIFTLGLILALLYRRTGSLPASMALHATFNAISVGLALAERFHLIRLT
jgi:membrane protease YdiL (CAAX protease family)